MLIRRSSSFPSSVKADSKNLSLTDNTYMTRWLYVFFCHRSWWKKTNSSMKMHSWILKVSSYYLTKRTSPWKFLQEYWHSSLADMMKSWLIWWNDCEYSLQVDFADPSSKKDLHDCERSQLFWQNHCPGNLFDATMPSIKRLTWLSMLCSKPFDKILFIRIRLHENKSSAPYRFGYSPRYRLIWRFLTHSMEMFPSMTISLLERAINTHAGEAAEKNMVSTWNDLITMPPFSFS